MYDDFFELKLSKNKITKVSLMDRTKIERYKWRARFDKHSNKFYAQTNIHSGYGKNRKTISWSLHRFLMDFPENRVVDHINGDTLDNRRANLRIVTNVLNNQNRQNSNYNNKTSKLRGITWHRQAGKWQVIIKFDNKTYYLGLFENKERAKDISELLRKYFLRMVKE